jgi:predicted negative regulator of RcsB-dependent stress response
MKKKEKEHLKADPFVHFMQQALAYVKGHRRPLLIGAGIVALAAVALLAVFLLHNLSSIGENRLYAEAFRVHNDGKMSVDQKIAALQGMKFRKGISASGHLFLAALHYEKGDMQKAEAVLAAMPGCRVALLNDEKHALYARVLAAAGREKEAEAVLARMLADGKTAMARELILLQLADMQVKGKRSAEAAATLKRILSEYAETPSAMEARTLLAGIKGAGAAGQ